MNVRYWVELSQAERGELTAMLSKGKRAARKLKRARMLLAADEELASYIHASAVKRASTAPSFARARET
jgi:hypothetical protein